jgi:hypothetical protein
MKGDFTRLTFAPEKHYSSVRMQQGRVQLDADWNEQLDIAAHRVETETIDVIGAVGASGDGFKISLQSGDVVLDTGRCYVDGILCENEQKCVMIGPAQAGLPVQPDMPTIAVPGQGNYVIYLDVWQRHLTAVEDHSILESAIDAQTATRTKTVWQAKLLPVTEDVRGEFPCGQTFGNWDKLTGGRSAHLQAQAAPDTSSSGPCIVPATAGYQRLENQLYRVEIHAPGSVGTATFKWSRDNGSVVSGVDKIDVAQKTITISDPGRDAYLSFAAGQWVELTNETIELNADLGPGILVRLTTPTEGTLLTYDLVVGQLTATTAATFTPASKAKARRWDQVDVPTTVGAIVSDATNWIPLEGGVQVCFQAGDTYATGDYWVIPARAVTALSASGTIEWPTSGTLPAFRERAGIKHHYGMLGTFYVAADNTHSFTDCRNVFPPLTGLANLYYAGGDGQEIMPDLTASATTLFPLAEPLRAGVTNGSMPVKGATVRFKVTNGGGNLQAGGGASGNTVDVLTGTDGIASCAWLVTNNNVANTVTAALLDKSGSAIGAPISYGANLSIASQVAFDPRNCRIFPGVKNVQDALDFLCKEQIGFPVIDEMTWANDRTLPVEILNLKGLAVTISPKVDPFTVNPSTFIVTAEIPDQYVLPPTPGVDAQPMPFRRSIILNGTIKAEGDKRFTFIPDPLLQRVIVERWLVDDARLFKARLPGIRCRVVLKGNFISGGGKAPQLDGNAFGFHIEVAAAVQPGIEIQLPSGDGVKGGDFESWFWLTPA